MTTTQSPFRVGTGFDVHQLVTGRRLVLGGVDIPNDKGLDGHSDADALLHAICDAILGALGLGDIGFYFPNNDPRWKDCDSTEFLIECARLAKEAGYTILNIDSTILAERPKMMAHIPKMKERISKAAGIPVNCIGIKATTMETMGFVGREEGIAAMAVAMLARS